MKVSEIIVRILELRGYKHVFMVTGGGSMHLNDSFGRSKSISVVPLHHEQSCSIAAESYYRTASLPAIVNVTSGPGGINALTGVYGAYVDSIPLIIIVRWTIERDYTCLRGVKYNLKLINIIKYL